MYAGTLSAKKFEIIGHFILGDTGAVSRVDKMFGVNNYCKIETTVTFHPEHFIGPTNCPWATEDELV